jgi:hypothetical protein
MTLTFHFNTANTQRYKFSRLPCELRIFGNLCGKWHRIVRRIANPPYMWDLLH